MKIADIQHAVSGCCSALSSNTSNATAWLGRNVQALGSKTANAAKTVGSTTWNTTSKVAHVAMAYLAKAALFVRFHAQAAFAGVKSLSGQAWDITKAGGSKSAELVKCAGAKILCGARTAVQATAAGAKTVATSLRSIASKVGSFAANTFAKSARVVKEAAIAGKNGLVQGFQVSKAFVASHQKETLIAGGILAVVLAVGYAAKNVLNRPAASAV